MAEDESTQPSTQQVLDPRRLGRNNSGLTESDISDVICILHPGTPAAYNIVKHTALRTPQHVLKRSDLLSFEEDDGTIEEQETIIIEPNGSSRASLGQDLALRFSSRTLKQWMGFTFGRNAALSDIVITVDSVKRVSNLHFRIYLNDAGVLMLEDMSTNGTLVDDVLLKGKSAGNYDSTRMLNPGSVIQILSTKEDEYIKFIVHLPSRQAYEEEYARKFHAYMERCRIAFEANGQKLGNARLGRNIISPGVIAETAAGAKRPLLGSAYTFGMHWNGGDKYNVVGQLGKGAFATVYKLATAMDGQLLAAKELEKKRFMKNGQLDQRLDNEMRIMQTIRHPNIVQYIDYQDVGNHLYIIMEYVPCGDLQAYLATKGLLSEQSARRMARQILHALAYLHQKKITHRDIKPDNILIAREEPFEVKLTDFGLSKVVKSNDTFLKTFCGTLLYCAPEVFPHYDSYVKGTKRRRGSSQKSVFHSYSQSVDIWSFAAVLWYSLCGKPPFEGVVDNTGRGMFDRIMGTDLDPTPLRNAGISEDAIDLLLEMLNTDPASRPTEQHCLQHRWLSDDEIIPNVYEHQLNAIEESAEEDLDDNTGGNYSGEGAEEEFSQLSLVERQRLSSRAPALLEEEEPELDMDSGEFELFLDENPSKRVKTDQLFPRNQTRDKDELESSEVSYANSQLDRSLGDSMTVPQPFGGRPRLFGEIGQSALQSSGILDEETNRALALTDYPSHDDESSRDLTGERLPKNAVGALSAASLLGAESLVRQLDMTSARSTASPSATPNDAAEPKTPDRHPKGDGEPQQSGQQSPQDQTPKALQPAFDRQIRLPKTASFYYDPYRPETHNLEYASRVSGVDFVGQAARTVSAGSVKVKLPALPDTMDMPTPEPNALDDNIKPLSQGLPTPEPISPAEEFAKPRPRLGRMTTTADSVCNLEIKFDQAWTSFGRLHTNTVVYNDVKDPRVPKKAFEIWFHHPDLQAYDAEGKDWTALDGLYTGITTWGRNGIWINGVNLKERDKEGRMQYGKVYRGDVVTVFQDAKSGTCLKFLIDIFKGEGAVGRKPGERFAVLKELQRKSASPENVPPTKELNIPGDQGVQS